MFLIISLMIKILFIIQLLDLDVIHSMRDFLETPLNHPIFFSKLQGVISFEK